MRLTNHAGENTNRISYECESFYIWIYMVPHTNMEEIDYSYWRVYEWNVLRMRVMSRMNMYCAAYEHEIDYSYWRVYESNLIWMWVILYMNLCCATYEYEGDWPLMLASTRIKSHMNVRHITYEWVSRHVRISVWLLLSMESSNIYLDVHPSAKISTHTICYEVLLY